MRFNHYTWNSHIVTRKCSDPSSSPLWTNSVNCIPIVLQAYYCPFLQSSHRKVAKWVVSINFNVGCVAEGEGGVRWVCNNQMFPLVLLKKLYQKNFWITLVMLNKTVSIITRKGTNLNICDDACETYAFHTWLWLIPCSVRLWSYRTLHIHNDETKLHCGVYMLLRN
jgi:hypothetical protein